MKANGWGRIVNIASTAGLIGYRKLSAYVAAKHGLQGLTKVTALEGGPHGVTATSVNPGYVRTPLVEQQVADQAASRGISEEAVLEQVFLANSAVPRMAEPEEVGSLVVWLASDAAGVANGSSFSLDGGWTAR